MTNALHSASRAPTGQVTLPDKQASNLSRSVTQRNGFIAMLSKAITGALWPPLQPAVKIERSCGLRRENLMSIDGRLAQAKAHHLAG